MNPAASSKPFLSPDPKTGDPSLAWEDFKNPKLRQFRNAKGLRLDEYVGAGIDGVVFKSLLGQKDPVVVKIFYESRAPNCTDGIGRYWAFERECTNCALLEMINTSLQRAKATDRPVYLDSKPKTKLQALKNLHAFSDEGRHDEQSHLTNYEAFEPDVFINRCLGWTQVKGSDINKALQGAPTRKEIKSSETYYCIVYDFVPKGSLNIDTVLAHLDFFHVTGFYNMPFNFENWSGNGVLVDFSDIVSPFALEPEWDAHKYANNQTSRYGLVAGLEGYTCSIGSALETYHLRKPTPLTRTWWGAYI